jgi:hypothetical protein
MVLQRIECSRCPRSFVAEPERVGRVGGRIVCEHCYETAGAARGALRGYLFERIGEGRPEPHDGPPDGPVTAGPGPLSPRQLTGFWSERHRARRRARAAGAARRAA